MDIREQAIETIRKTNTGKLSSSLFQKAKLFAWETGLGPLINVKPEILGQQAVLYFPGRSGKFSFPCYEDNGHILLALTEKELNDIRENLFQNPGVELWLKQGWYNGTVRLLTDEEKAAVMETVPDEQFFGYMLRSVRKPSLQDHYLLEAVRSAPCTGSSGPGSKSWVWPLSALFLLLLRKKR